MNGPAAAPAVHLGRLGIRAWQLSDLPVGPSTAMAAELEALGFGALWIRASGFFERAEALLGATNRVVVASSVLSVWEHDPQVVARQAAVLRARFPGRLLIGLGISHRPLVDRDAPGRFQRPLDEMHNYLDVLDEHGLPPEGRVIAALGPRMLDIARHRSAGTHPYLVSPAHTAEARAKVGPARLVAPAHVTVLVPDRSEARAAGRRHLSDPYLNLPNYRRTLLRLGFEPADLESGGSDRLVDALVAGGPADKAATALTAHLRSGADHVAVQLLTPNGENPLHGWRALAGVLPARV